MKNKLYVEMSAGIRAKIKMIRRSYFLNVLFFIKKDSMITETSMKSEMRNSIRNIKTSNN